jgi:hypothetical protein
MSHELRFVAEAPRPNGCSTAVTTVTWGVGVTYVMLTWRLGPPL